MGILIDGVSPLLFLIAATEKATKIAPDVVRAPEVLDTNVLQTWFSNSIAGLMGLNLLALIFFLLSLMHPQVALLKKIFVQLYRAVMKKNRAAAVPIDSAPNETTPADQQIADSSTLVQQPEKISFMSQAAPEP